MQEHKKQQTESGDFDEWVKNFFLDPSIHTLDIETFQIDIYEDDDEYFIEALLENHEIEDLEVRLHDYELTISVQDQNSLYFPKKVKSNTTKRSIFFPFLICHRQIRAEYSSSLLTIRIHKFLTCSKQTSIKIE